MGQSPQVCRPIPPRLWEVTPHGRGAQNVLLVCKLKNDDMVSWLVLSVTSQIPYGVQLVYDE